MPSTYSPDLRIELIANGEKSGTWGTITNDNLGQEGFTNLKYMDADVVLDGGVRRGSDVVKAVALGAKAVMIGRAYLWGLAANGQAGVENVLDVLRGGIDATLTGLGKGSIHDLDRSDVVAPADFYRTLGQR